jgi:pimeloyl-ACP methyl ester carboxylesterase
VSEPRVFHSQPTGATASYDHSPREPRRSSAVGYSVQGDGPAVVLLHSSMSHKGQWDALAEQLSRGHRVIAVDLFGYGDTPFPLLIHDFGLADEARLVEWVLQETLQADEPFHLIGHSYGGAVALHLAHSLPQRVKSLALFEPTAFHLLARKDATMTDVQALTEVQVMARSVNRGLANGNLLPAAARFIDYWSGSGAFARLSKEKRHALAQQLRKVSLDFLAVCSEPLTLADCRSITIPVCLIAGLLSPLSAQAVTAALAKNLPDNQLHWVNAGHMAPITEADKVNPIFSGFIQQVGMAGFSFAQARSRRAARSAPCPELVYPPPSQTTTVAA